jgi:ketosteroid isomerase-like protein
MTQDNVELMRSLYDALGRGDVPTVLSAMDPKIEWNEAEGFPYADGNPYVGPDAVAEGVLTRLGTEWDYWNIATEDVFGAGDRVVVTGRYRAKNKKSGATLDAQFAHHWTLRDGRITRFQQYTDTGQAQKATSSS